MINVNLPHLFVFAILLLVTVLYQNTASAERYTMHQIEELPSILDKATENTMVIFDVDEVLVYPENIIQLQVASPFWEAKMADIEKRIGKPQRDLLHSIMLLQSHWKLTDVALPKIIKSLQYRKIRVLALTSFRTGKMGNIPSVEDWRSLHLKTHNIDFSVSVDLPQSFFEINNLKKSDGTKKPVYKDGIIYTDLHSKGDVLQSFLEQTNLSPKEIIFIDDRISNIKDLEVLCRDFKINYIGIHDNRLLKQYSSFDKKLGEFQFQYLENQSLWLSDNEARQKMESAICY